VHDTARGLPFAKVGVIWYSRARVKQHKATRKLFCWRRVQLPNTADGSSDRPRTEFSAPTRLSSASARLQTRGPPTRPCTLVKLGAIWYSRARETKDGRKGWRRRTPGRLRTEFSAPTGFGSGADPMMRATGVHARHRHVTCPVTPRPTQPPLSSGPTARARGAYWERRSGFEVRDDCAW
jgi:hypothetical protein